MRDRATRLGYVPDEQNPIDFVTKWVDRAKVEASVAYLTNSRSRAAHEGYEVNPALTVLRAHG